MLDALDKQLISALQDDFPLTPEPYKEFAQRLGISEDEVLRRLQKYCKSGKVRKMGAVLRHRAVGYAANALCAWIVLPERLEEVGLRMSAYSEVTHCYARVAQPSWPYNFYVMLHAHTRQECAAIASSLAQNTGLTEYVMLYSTKEWKKTSMHYFREE